MKKITLLAVFFMAGLTTQAQSTLTSATATGQDVTIELDQNRAPIVITQSNTQTIASGEEIACASTTAFRDNYMYRDFDLVNDHGLTDGLAVTGVEIAIGPVSTPAGFPMTANIYSTADAFPPNAGTLQGTGVVTITNADAESFVTIPVTGTIPAGERLIVEVIIIDDGTETNFMRFGCNSDGEIGPSYIDAPVCGTTGITPFADLGLTQGLVWNVTGDDNVAGVNDNLLSQVSVYPNPASDVLNVKVPATVEVTNAVLYDVLGKNTGVQLVNGSMNTADLARGVYILNINTSAGSLTEKVVKN